MVLGGALAIENGGGESLLPRKQPGRANKQWQQPFNPARLVT